MTINSISNSFVVALVASGILAAIASTADALLCAIGANLAQDFSFGFLGLSPLRESKVIILFMGIVILGMSYIMPTNIITILVKSYEIPVSCLLVPLLVAYFSKNVNKYAGFGSVIGGAAALIVCKLIIPVEFSIIYELTLSLLGYGIGSLFKYR